MTHVVTSACINHKYQDCVAVCPVEAFRELPTYLVIDPDESQSNRGVMNWVNDSKARLELKHRESINLKTGIELIAASIMLA